MFCPHCGTENDAGNRFCVSCGSVLSASAPTGASKSSKERLARLLGNDRRTRIVTAATAAAIVIAIIAFLSLGSSDDSAEESAYLQGLDRTCVAEKERVIALERETLQRQPSDLSAFASVLVTIVAEWHSGLRSQAVPTEYASGVAAYEASLLRILIAAGGLARLTRENASGAALASQAKMIDETTKQADEAIEKLGLTECTELAVAPDASG